MRRAFTVLGIVQGVGFRPHVHALANRLQLAGFVANDRTGVRVEVEGPPAQVAEFGRLLVADAPPLAVIDEVRADDRPLVGDAGFRIASSTAAGAADVLVSPDVATCGDCLDELADPADRRYRYPFINCTNCGPRFTIVRDVPYDRPNTTMAAFTMCAACRREYTDPHDRRFHAQPVCCPTCGPRLVVTDPAGAPLGGEPVQRTVELLAAGAIVAIKGIGGYHLAVRADSEQDVARLRARKRREDKPFAVMVADLAAADRLCELAPAARLALSGPAAPIVLAPRRPGAGVADSTAPRTASLGVLLPYTPLHHLLLAGLGVPMVLTSGNVSDEPIAYADDDARARLAGIAEAFCTHDRRIHVRTDDSVLRQLAGRVQPVRRSRGFVPAPVTVPWRWAQPVLATGAELKNTFCLARGDRAFVSHHIGDLENAETLAAFVEGIEHFRRLFDVTPAVVAHDLHPEYLSTKHATALPGVRLVGVQHHHAHVVACLADNRHDGPVIGVAFDGLGYGTDGTLWGGEFLAVRRQSFDRLGAFQAVPLPGGAAAVRAPWRMAAAYLHAAGLAGQAGELAERHAAQWAAVLKLAAIGLNSPPTSSVGRLFDAVAAILGLRDEVTYEGQAAVELEQCAARCAGPVADGYAPAVADGTPFRVSGVDLVAAVVADLRAGVDRSRIAARFHAGVATAVLAGCRIARERTGLSTVALSGGVFQNVLLTRAAEDYLAADGFAVLTHHRVPPNDGGVSLGQAVVAAATDPP